ncbi:hypothetical protein J2S17_001825 [Cytobacillus purgationiresistens]|uniref:Uncharacterized protein n=1 Tax=Cytobacillus purgationiresistens TaxID=863449 RepID=A0ABU0AFB5_9BACI|nr:hypothetical protein [Cytobacillus purgationiresistens]
MIFKNELKLKESEVGGDVGWLDHETLEEMKLNNYG